jgi:hypothetical protein
MRTYDDPRSRDYNPKAVEADRALGRSAADIIRERRYADFVELVYTGVGDYEPKLIYRNGDSFLVVETEVRDGGEEETGVWGRKLEDGRVAEMGTRPYLLAGIHDLTHRTEAGKNVGIAVLAALADGRVRYLLVSAIVSGQPGERELTSIESCEFRL